METIIDIDRKLDDPKTDWYARAILRNRRARMITDFKDACNYSKQMKREKAKKELEEKRRKEERERYLARRDELFKDAMRDNDKMRVMSFVFRDEKFKHLDLFDEAAEYTKGLIEELYGYERDRVHVSMFNITVHDIHKPWARKFLEIVYECAYLIRRGRVLYKRAEEMTKSFELILLTLDAESDASIERAKELEQEIGPDAAYAAEGMAYYIIAHQHSTM